MNLFVWKREWETGIQEIDDQHRALLLQMDQLFEAIHKGEEHSEVSNTLRHLALYVDYHFRTEERLMTQTGYGALPAHKACHDVLRETVKGVIRSQEAGSPSLLVDVVDYLQHWLFDHLDTLDREMAAHLREALVAPTIEVAGA
jgi:hemerythrin-like metal-binding protein